MDPRGLSFKLKSKADEEVKQVSVGNSHGPSLMDLSTDSTVWAVEGSDGSQPEVFVKKETDSLSEEYE